MNKKFMLNTLLIILEVIGFIITWFVNGWSLFTYYTQDSNLFFLFSCICYEVWMIRNSDFDIKEMPRWIYLLKYFSTCMLLVTFIIIVFVLAPMGFTVSVAFGMELLVGNANLFHHIFCPILGTLAFIKVDNKEPLTLKNNLLALIPTIIYASITLWANIEGILYGPYPFLHVYEQSVLVSVLWVLAIGTVSFVLAFLLRLLKDKICDLRKKQ